MSVSPEMMATMVPAQDEPTDGTNPASLPQQRPAYGPPDESTVQAEMQTRLKAAERFSQDWRDEAKELYDYEAGNQWSTEDENTLREQSRPMVTFNVMQKFLDAVCGLQINNRQEIRCYPRTTGKVRVSDIATGCIAWNRDLAHTDIEESDAAHDLLLTGMGWMEHFYDDEGRSQGHIAGERRDPIEMYWDPSARRKNLIDRKWQIRVRYVSPDDYKDLFGVDPVGSIDSAGTMTNEQGRIEHIIKPQDYDNNASGSAALGPKVAIADYQWCCVHHYKVVTAVFYGQPSVEQFSLEEWRDIEPKMKQAGIPYQVQHQKQKAYYRAWVTGEGVMGGIKTLPYGFTFQAITGKRERNTNLWYGLGRGIKDPQKWVNKFFSSILWQLAVNPKGGLLAEKDAFEDVAHAEDSWANPSAITLVTKNALRDGKVQPKPASQYPQGMDRLMQFSIEALPQVSGINAELLGMTDRQQPGIVEAQRKQGALAIVAWFFDALRRYYQEAGEVTLSMSRDLIADGRLIKIIGEDGAQYVNLFRDPLLQEFDVIVDEAPTSVNMQERVFAVLQQMVPLAATMGVKIPKKILDYVPLPAALQEEWKAELNPSPQQQEQQQMREQTMQRAANASIAKDESSAQLNQAKAQEAVVNAQVKSQAAPVDVAHQQVLTLKEASQAGRIQAGA